MVGPINFSVPGSPSISFGSSINNRTSSNPTFTAHLANATAGGANVLAGVTGVAAPYVPGSAVLSAALNQASGQIRATNTPVDLNAAPMQPGGAGQPPEFAQSAAQMHKEMMDSNMYMLGLQQRFNQLGIQFTSQSNMLKAKHDAEKNSVANFR